MGGRISSCVLNKGKNLLCVILSIFTSCKDRIDSMVAWEALAFETTAGTGFFSKVDSILLWSILKSRTLQFNLVFDVCEFP